MIREGFTDKVTLELREKVMQIWGKNAQVAETVNAKALWQEHACLFKEQQEASVAGMQSMRGRVIGQATKSRCERNATGKNKAE